jgi:hypothetical protein
MMLFGSRETFAVEAMIEPHLKPPSAPWGRLCIWCEGVAIGDFGDENCGLECIERLAELPPRLGELWLSEFEGLDDVALWNVLDGALYGYHGDRSLEAGRTLDEIHQDWHVYGRFDFLTNWGEMFDRAGKSFIIRVPDHRIKILNRPPPLENVVALFCSEDAFCAAIGPLVGWFEEQSRVLRTQAERWT